MGNNLDQLIRPILSGEKRGLRATVVRGSLRIAEIPYTLIVTARNALYQRHIFKSHRLARPVISVGNITTGGTGKTPVVRWLAEHLRDHRPAILMRGYKSADDISDEQMLLQQQLPGVPVIARPNRIRGAAAALAQQSDTGLFLLDDGMQHRKIARDFELVLIDATNPFGFGHVLPRGLLREPLAGLSRAHAFLITHADLISPSHLQALHTLLTSYNPQAPVYNSNHVIKSVRLADQCLSIDSLQGKDLFLFCAIGNPDSLRQQLAALKLNLVDAHLFPDHHAYTRKDLTELAAQRSASHVDLLITTEKDWTKIAPLNHELKKMICRTELSLSFPGNDEADLLGRIRTHVFSA